MRARCSWPLAQRYYSTTFSGTENPISESGRWISGGSFQYQANVQTGGGFAYGTQVGDEYLIGADGTPGKYNDSQAILAGSFPRNQRVECTIRRSGWPVGGNDLEVEILLGGSYGSLRSLWPGTPSPKFGPTQFDGIETVIGLGSYGLFTGAARYLEEACYEELNTGTLFGMGGPADGDIFAAQLTLNDSTQQGTVVAQIKRSGSWTTIWSITHADLYRVGNPGVAFYRQGTSGFTPDQYCFTDFTAWGYP